jgi:hypothetical protein
MKGKTLLSLLIPPLVGVAAAWGTPLALWYDMKEGLIAFLGFLAAALVQVMPITANFLQSDKLTPTEAEKLLASLTRQQHYWIGLLTATIVTLVVVIVGVALKGRVEDLQPLFEHRLFMDISWGAVVVFFVASSLSFVLVKMLGLFDGLLSLHHLRGELVINSAKRDAAEKATKLQQSIDLNGQITPEGYGQIIRPH